AILDPRRREMCSNELLLTQLPTSLAGDEVAAPYRQLKEVGSRRQGAILFRAHDRAPLEMGEARWPDARGHVRLLVGRSSLAVAAFVRVEHVSSRRRLADRRVLGKTKQVERSCQRGHD